MELAECKKTCQNILDKEGVSLICPILYNGRLTTTLGRVCYNSKGLPSRIEFSRSFMRNRSESEIMDLVKHELAHYIIAVRMGEPHGHDKYFVEECQKLGTNNIGEIYSQEKGKAVTNYRYALRCSKCGRLIRYYKRDCATLKNAEFYKSSCCQSPLKVEKLK